MNAIQAYLFPPIPAPTPVSPRGLTIEEQFREFHRRNPHVYHRLRELAFQMKGRGHRRIGMKMLFEVLRWQHAMSTSDPASEFKLNNSYTAYYARLLMQQEPALDGLFATRKQKS